MTGTPFLFLYMSQKTGYGNIWEATVESAPDWTVDVVTTHDLDRPVFNFDALLKRTGKNKKLVFELWQEWKPQLLKANKQVAWLLKQGESDKIPHYIHGLRGTAANLGAEALALACKKLEQDPQDEHTLSCFYQLSDLTLRHVELELTQDQQTLPASNPTIADSIGSRSVAVKAQQQVQILDCGHCKKRETSPRVLDILDKMQANEYIPISLSQNLAQALGCNESSNKATEIQKCVEAFDYKSALSQLKALPCLRVETR